MEGEGPPRTERRPPLPGLARAAGSGLVRRVLPRSAGVHLRLQLRRARGLRRDLVRLESRELPLPLGPAVWRGLPAHARALALRHGRDAPRRLPGRLLARPLRAAQDAPAPARDPPLLD